MKKIALIYLSYHCEPYIEEMARSVTAVNYPRVDLELVIVDNPHPDYGLSAPYLEKNILPLAGVTLPVVTILPQEINLGFAGGNNVGMEYAIAQGFDFVYFLNNDAYLGENTFQPLVAAFAADPQIGITQSLVLLHPERDKINSSGNAIQFCGFGYCRDYQVPVAERNFPAVAEIPYASGTAFMIPTELCKKFGGWDPDFFMYHEDMEWSLRLKAMGYKIVLVPASTVYHAYEFQRSINKYFFMERNRFGVLLLFLKWPTLFLIGPAVLLYEIGTYFFALQGGWWREKHKLYAYWLRPVNWKLWLGKRVIQQSRRVITDRALTANWVGEVKFQEARIENPVLRYLANPLMAAYWALAKKLLFW